MKKLTDEQITHLEAWFKSKKEMSNLSPEEKTVFDRIKGMVECNWQGVRVEKSELDDAWQRLEKLKRKVL